MSAVYLQSNVFLKTHYSFQIASVFYWCIQIFSFWIHTCLEIDNFFRVLLMVPTSCVISFSDAQ